MGAFFRDRASFLPVSRRVQKVNRRRKGPSKGEDSCYGAAIDPAILSLLAPYRSEVMTTATYSLAQEQSHRYRNGRSKGSTRL